MTEIKNCPDRYHSDMKTLDYVPDIREREGPEVGATMLPDGTCQVHMQDENGTLVSLAISSGDLRNWACNVIQTLDRFSETTQG